MLQATAGFDLLLPDGRRQAELGAVLDAINTAQDTLLQRCLQ